MQQWIRCPRCGANNAPGQRFCNACGNPLPSACPNCGTPVNPGATFCPRCGMQFGGQQGHYQQPQQPGYPPQTGYYPPQQPGYPPQQPGYPPQQPGYPPQQPGYTPQQPGYPPQQPGYPPQQTGYPPQQPGYPPQQMGYPPQQPGYPPQQPGYPPQQPGYPPRPGFPPPPSRPAGGGGSGGGKGMLIFLLVLLLAGLGGFGYWAHTQGYLKSLPFQTGSDNGTSSASTGPKLTTAPKISNIKVSQSAVDGFCITWDTDQFSSSQLEYGPKGSFDSKTTPTHVPSSSNMGVISHGVCVTNLQANTEYQYRCISTNKDGLTGMSDIMYVTTPSAD